MNRKSLVLFLAFCVPLLWFVSGASVSNGVVVFAVLMLPTVICIWTAKRGRFKPLFVSFLCLILFAATLVIIETALWLKPDLLAGQAALHVYGGYHVEPGGIYQRDRHIGYVLRANCNRRIYWNGHWWRHNTNEHGYRGKAVAKPQAVFLGDSMIYGHGVEGDETVSSRFAIAAGLQTVNLGQQGTSLVQTAARLEQLGRNWNPKYVFVCSHYNDVAEVSAWYPSPEMKRYCDDTAREPFVPSVHRALWPRAAWRPRYFWNEHIALPLHVARIVQYFSQRLRQSAPESNQTNRDETFIAKGLPAAAFVASSFTPWSGTESERIGWDANVQALRRIHRYCKARDAKMVVFDLGYPRSFAKAIEKTANELGVMYVPAGRTALEHGLSGADVYLPNDGHWSPQGCEYIAKQLAGALP